MKKIMFVVFAVSMAFASCSNSSNPAMYYPNTTTTGTQNPTEGTTTSPNNPNPNGDGNNGNENGGGQNENGGENNNGNENQNGGGENNNGNENQNGSGGGSSTTLAANECDMGCDFDLAYYADKIYVNGTPAEWSRYDTKWDVIPWTHEHHACGKIYLDFYKSGNKLIAKKSPNYDITRLFNILKVEKTSDDRIDVTIERVSEN